MRIVLVNRYFHPDESATSRMVSSLAFGQAAQNVKVTILASRFRHDDPHDPLPRREDLDGVSVHRLPASHYGRAGLAGRAADYLSFHAAAALWCLRHVRRGDIVIACTDPPLLSVTLAASLAGRGAHLVNWLHDLFPEVAIELDVLTRTGVVAWALLGLRDWSLGLARTNVVPTDAMAQALGLRGVASGKTAIIPYWSEEAIVPVHPDDNRLRREWNLADPFVVGYSGNFGRAHEFRTLLDAADLLRDEPGIRFLLIGGGYARRHVEEEIRRRRLANVVLRPLQARARLTESLSVADVHLISLLPALEPYVVPSKLYGILAAARPAIFIGASDGEVAMALRRHGCGETVSIGDAPALARQIIALQRNPAMREARGANARLAFDIAHRREHGLAAWTTLLQGIATDRRSPDHENDYSAASGAAASDGSASLRRPR
jgi:colanic acid biosynthesis glycosyl transferase WcaI